MRVEVAFPQDQVFHPRLFDLFKENSGCGQGVKGNHFPGVQEIAGLNIFGGFITVNKNIGAPGGQQFLNLSQPLVIGVFLANGFTCPSADQSLGQINRFRGIIPG